MVRCGIVRDFKYPRVMKHDTEYTQNPKAYVIHVTRAFCKFRSASVLEVS